MVVETINARLLFPRSKEQDGDYFTNLAIFAARRCRTTKFGIPLWKEVESYSNNKKENFLNHIVHEEWALDILEMMPLHYDISHCPVWLIIEFLRHRLLWRDFSMEQLSQRAIPSDRLEINVPEEFRLVVDNYMDGINQIIKENPHIKPEDYRAAFPQGVEVNFVVAGNLRAFQHFFFMRNSVSYEGAGGAHPLFQKLSDQMTELAREVYPIAMSQIAKA